ncbi:MAG: hypothetical protein QOE97_3399 [Pseudonocardiales bacterium]|nr:hypothetical protein [Pseudonocardiales bacterium]
MAAVAELGLRAAGPFVLDPAPPPPGMSRIARPPRWALIATALAVANGTAFFLVQPGVNDLWAARARASAVSHGVGLTYWFSWFGGGSTPGNYSVLTPYLSALISAELVCALSAVAITALTAFVVRDAPHPAAATAVATVAAGINLWSGRVPFLLGCALAITALIAVRKQQRVRTVLATVLTVLASPVSAAFLALGLAGAFLTSRAYRTVSGIAIGAVVVAFGAVALAFGTPGTQHFSLVMCLESCAALTAFLVASPGKTVRAVIWLSFAVVLAMLVIPSGMGSNFGRMTWFCLPVAVVAFSSRRAWLATLLVVPVLGAASNLTISDLRQAGQPVAGTEYYTPLGAELDRIQGMSNFRLEVVAETAHAAYDALLDHAMLARGWETQEDNALNSTLMNPGLDPTSYKIWLDNNSVGYVAVPASKVDKYPEFTLVSAGLPYLSKVWTSADWSLYRVQDPTPIVAAPQSVLTYGQSAMTVRATCACTFSLRIRFSKFLHGRPLTGTGTGRATFTSDGYGYTSMTTSAPGDYELRGSVTKFFH